MEDIMINYIEKKQLANQIISNIMHQHCFLLMGKNTEEKDVTENVCKLRWSAVIHDSKDFNLAKKFELDGRIIKISNLSEDNTPLPNKQILPFIVMPEDEDKNEIIFSLNKLLSNYLKNLCRLYVIGMDFSDELLNTLKLKAFNGRITFLGVSQNDLDSILCKSLKDKYNFEICTYSLDEILKDNTIEYEFGTENEESNLVFYSNGMQYSIPEIELIGIHGIVSLLNRNLIENNIPIGRTTQSRAFEKFLECSPSEGPQWYAYSKDSSFIVEREYQKVLISIVSSALENRTMPDDKNYDGSNPIVLMGESASSKSIMLGSLAAEMFNNHKFPVLFIDSKNLDFSSDNNSNILEKINWLMERIERCDSQAKFLLIWDCSAMQINSIHSSQKVAQSLNRQLLNRGRRFVLLYSCYQHELSKNKKCYKFLPSENKFRLLPTNDDFSQSDLCFNCEEWIVQAFRKLSDNEVNDVKHIFEKYGNIVPPQQFWEEQKNSNADLFSYFYRLTIILHDHLKQHFSYERSYFQKYHNEHLNELFHKYKCDSSLHFDDETLKLLGIQTEEKIITDDKIDEKLKKFQKCIAVFSQFYLNTPHSLALSFIHDEFSQYYYSSESRDIYLFAERRIPWIKSIEINGTFYFIFRSNDEATIYLSDESENYTQEQMEANYLNFIIQILNQYLKLSNANGEGDSDIVRALVILLRQLGPNSQKKSLYWSYIQDNLYVITDKLKEIIEAGFDTESSLELTFITFTREYYSSKLLKMESSDPNVDQLNDAIFQIKKALGRCISAIDQLKTSINIHSQNIYYQLVNEKILCNILITDYNNRLPNKSHENFVDDFITDFSILFSEIEQIVYRNPENGFCYNSLFKLFEKWYGMKGRSKNEIMRYSSHLANIIDQINGYEIYHRDPRGSDELSEHIAKFQTMLAGFNNITISQFEKKSDLSFNEIFDNSTPHDKAAYIWLVCYNELNTPEMQYLNNPQNNEYVIIPNNICKRCKEIFEFIEKYYSFVKTNGSTLQLMLRIFWIWKTKSELRLKGELNECRLTKLTENDWEIINRICRDYCKSSDNRGASPFMKYMNVLSMASTQKLEKEDDIKEIIKQLHTIDEASFQSLRRMYTPFVLCNSDGTPRQFTGKVTLRNERNGKITLSSPRCENLYYNENNLTSNNYLHTSINVLRTDLVIGIGYTRPQIYSYEYIMKKEERRKEKKNESK